jgi:hypothetical protein
LLATAQTDQAGRYSTDTLVNAAGGWRFRATFAGDARYAVANAGPLDVTGQAQRAPLSITSSRSLIRYGSAVTLTATLGPTHTNRVVQILRIATDGSRVLVAQGAVTAGGSFSVSVSPGRKTRYVAHFAGDAWFAPRDAGPVTILVQPIVTIVADNAYRQISGIRLFHYQSACVSSGSGCPRFTARVRPSHAGSSVTYTLQHRTTGAWKTYATATFRLNKLSQSTVIFHYPGTGVRAGVWRVKAHFRADTDHTASDSPWLVFRVTA